MAPVVIEARYNGKDGLACVPEGYDGLIQIWSEELENAKSYWQVGTSPVTRVKISALSPDALIDTSKAGTIEGTASENFEKIKTLGTVRITVYEKFYNIEAHVTRSKNVAPFALDGIIGLDVIKSEGWLLDQEAGIFHRPKKLPSLKFSLLSPNHHIPDYDQTVREKIKLLNLSKEKNEWACVSQRLQQARRHLPPEVEKETRSPVIDVLDDYADCLFLPGDKIPPSKLLKYSIKSDRNDIFNCPQPDHPEKDANEIELIVEDLLRQDILRKSTSPYNSPMCLLAKKPDARGNVYFRLSGEYSQLNSRSESETFPIPDIYEAIDQLHGSKYFSVLDLASASYHIPLEREDRRKTAFTTKSGRYEFRRVPVNMKNSGQYMQLLMSQVLEGMLGKEVFVCHDDILIYAPTIEEHEIRIRKVFNRLRAHGLKLQPGKCQLFKSKVSYLGFLITDEGVLPDPAKIEKLRLPQRPDSHKALRSWLGLLSWHKSFLRRYAGRAQPISDLLKNDIFHWTVEARNNYQSFQQMLREKLVLRYPDWNRSFSVRTGFDDYGIYAGLRQKPLTQKKGRPKTIAWSSRTYSPAESRLDACGRMKLAVDFAFQTFPRGDKNVAGPPLNLSERQ